jgi:hypothetical protein
MAEPKSTFEIRDKFDDSVIFTLCRGGDDPGEEEEPSADFLPLGIDFRVNLPREFSIFQDGRKVNRFEIRFEGETGDVELHFHSLSAVRKFSSFLLKALEHWGG